MTTHSPTAGPGGGASKKPRPSIAVRDAARKLTADIDANGWLADTYARHFTRFETAILAESNKRAAALESTIRALYTALERIYLVESSDDHEVFCRACLTYQHREPPHTPDCYARAALALVPDPLKGGPNP